MGLKCKSLTLTVTEPNIVCFKASDAGSTVAQGKRLTQNTTGFLSLLGTMPSDYIHQHELKCDRGGASLHVINQAYKQAMWLPFDQINIHTQSISALNFTVSSQVMSMSCQGIAVSGNQCHVKLNQGCNRFTQFNSQAAAGES